LPNLNQHIDSKRFGQLATHGYVGSDARPYDACLALTPPLVPTPQDIGFLRLEDIIRHWRGKLAGCELVVLSACISQLAERVGDSALSLPTGFFYAGASAVIASNWFVDDTSTARLMTRMYELILESPRTSKLESFTTARKSLRAQQPHPYYWAPFVYLGDPR
jgi:CHAT domain-containing protein